MEQFFNFIIYVIKLPFVSMFKTLFTLLNLIPLPVYELHGLKGTGKDNRPDLRENHTKIKGKRRVHLGTFIIAWVRGSVISAYYNSKEKCLGVYSEDYQDILNKWIW